ncbi:MAG: hypothetical protein ABJL72_19895 [Roseobacter sp.]
MSVAVFEEPEKTKSVETGTSSEITDPGSKEAAWAASIEVTDITAMAAAA